MRGMTLSQWLDLLIDEYSVADILDMLRMHASDHPKYHKLTILLEEAVSLACEVEAKSGQSSE